MDVKSGQNRKKSLSVSSTGLLLVCTSLFVWLSVDTVITVIPSTELKFEKYQSSSLANSNLGADHSHLWWILQISDIHISSYRNFHIPDSLKLFFKEVIPTVKPSVVLATGDLTDGKKSNILLSAQERSEWETYKSLLEEHFFGNKHLTDTDERYRSNNVTWIDMRGNHDKFDVPVHGDDFYSKFSPFSYRWKSNDRHIVHKFSVNGTAYAIVATDATPNPGLRRPYNFFGVLSEATLNEFQQTDVELSKEGVQLAIWSGHYTGSTIFVGGTYSSERRLIGGIIQHGAVYLCGHLHTLYDAETAMYARHAPFGQIELELADFQRTQRFRVVAVDHGLLSFTDVPLGRWPLVLVLNPKEALYAMPNHEPLEKIANSTHIRILAFSTSPIVSVQVMLDGKFIGNATQTSPLDSLYTLPWFPRKLSSKSESLFHRLHVTVIDSNKRSTSEEVAFFVDQKAVHQLPANIGGPFSSLVLLVNIPRVCRNAFVGSSLFCIILLMAARFHPNIFKRCVPSKTLGHGFVSFANVPRLLFITILFVIAYPIFGPWFLGEVLTARYGFVFAHGILLIEDGNFIPCGVVAYQGFVNVMTFYFPLLFYFSWLFSSVPISRSRPCRVIQRLLFQFLIMWQLWAAYCDAQAYSWLAFFFNPMRTWSSLAIVYIDIQARKNIVRC